MTCKKLKLADDSKCGDLWLGFNSWWMFYKPSWWYRVEDFWYQQISSRIFPRNRWLTKVIPRTWIDKDGLLDIVLKQFIISFVEDEKCFETIDWTAFNEQAVFAQQLKRHYDWLKYELPKLRKQADTAWGLSEFEVGKNLEAQINKKQTMIFIWLVENRKYFWT